MKFFKERNLKTKVAIVLAFLLLIFSFQFVILRWKMNALEVLHAHGNYARKTQLINQQIFLNTNLYLQGQSDLSAQLIADVSDLDHHLEILEKGGRVDNTMTFLDNLPRLPKISYKELSKHWLSYRRTTLAAMLNKEEVNKNEIIRLLPGKWTTLSSWYDRLIDDLDESLNEKRRSLNLWIIIFIILDVALLSGLYYFSIRFVIKPIQLIAQNTNSYIHTHLHQSGELGAMTKAVNQVIEELKDATDFVQNIGQGKLGIAYTDLDPNYHPGKNKLADSLIEMQAKLKELNEEEKKRQWTNEGITKFVDILRAGGDDINALGDMIISALVQYTGSNQGGLYLVNDEESKNKFLELISLFAFDTKKYAQQRIKPGEGILGQTFLEKETTYLTKVPHEYVSITSGLGGTHPKALLIVPLKIDKEVYGVVELASFAEFQQHEITFVERLGETIASSLANVKSAQKNRRLLEESKASQEMMRSQEEEMRQNMEELTATQEEIARKEREYVEKIRDLEQQLTIRDSSTQTDALELALENMRKESEATIKELELKLAEKPTHTEEWAVAEEVEKTLRTNLEALKIVQEELRRPHKS